MKAMHDDKLCPFWFGNSFNDVYCCETQCALWVRDAEFSACGLAYQPLLDAKIRKRVAQARHYFTTGRGGDGDA